MRQVLHAMLATCRNRAVISDPRYDKARRKAGFSRAVQSYQLSLPVVSRMSLLAGVDDETCKFRF